MLLNGNGYGGKRGAARLERHSGLLGESPGLQAERDKVKSLPYGNQPKSFPRTSTKQGTDMIHAYGAWGWANEINEEWAWNVHQGIQAHKAAIYDPCKKCGSERSEPITSLPSHTRCVDCGRFNRVVA